MKGYIYLTKERNSDGTELKHDGLTKIGIGKTNDPIRRFREHHNKGSKSTTELDFISDFEVDDMDHVESQIHKTLKSLGYQVVYRISVFGDSVIESTTEVFTGISNQTGEEISEKLIVDIVKSILTKEQFIKTTLQDFNPHFLQELAILKCLDAIENESEESVNLIAELCARFGKTLTYLELFRRLENDVMIIPSYVHTVFTSFGNEILGKYNDENIGKWSNFHGFKLIDTTVGGDWQKKLNDNLGKSKLVVFVSIQTPEDSFSKFDIIKDIDKKRKFVLIDEADYGAWTEKSKKIIDYIV